MTDKITIPPAKILLVRLSAIGDVVHGLPVAVALRKRFPQARIAWLVEEKIAPLIENHPALDEIWTVPKAWMKSFSTIRDLRKRLREFSPDVAIDLQGLLKSSFAAWLSGAKTRIGFGGKDGREGSRWLNNRLVTPTRDHVIDRNLQLLEPLGITDCVVEFQLPEKPEDHDAAEKILAGLGLTGAFAVLNVGAGWDSKLWREDRYAEVARHLKSKHDLPSLVVWAGPREQVMAEQVVKDAGDAAILAPRTSLGELASISRKAALFIGSDTGPLHIAVAVGTRCVGLYGPMSAKRNGPYGTANRSVQIRSLEGTNINPHHAPRDLMDAIEAKHVLDACEEILSSSRPPVSVDTLHEKGTP